MTTWPAGARGAVAFTFDFDAEEVWIGDDPENVNRPGVLSQGTYGAKVAVPRILELLQRHDLQQTFFVPGRVAERYPGRLREIVAAGHEVGHHGYTHTSPAKLERPAEEAELVPALEVLHGLGADPVGYRSPSWEFSASTIELLQKHGFRYSSNYMDDLHPYLHPGAASSSCRSSGSWTTPPTSGSRAAASTGRGTSYRRAGTRHLVGGAGRHRRSRRRLHHHDAPAGDRPAAPARVPRRLHRRREGARRRLDRDLRRDRRGGRVDGRPAAARHRRRLRHRASECRRPARARARVVTVDLARSDVTADLSDPRGRDGGRGGGGRGAGGTA